MLKEFGLLQTLPAETHPYILIFIEFILFFLKGFYWGMKIIYELGVLIW